MIDIYETRTMLRALEEIPKPLTFLKDTFFHNTPILSETDSIDIDVVKENRLLPVYVRPVQEGHVVQGGGFTTNTYKVPYIKEKIPTHAGQLFARAAGETVYSASTPMQRAAQKFNSELLKLERMFTRAEEIQCMQGMFEGKVTCKNEAGTAIQVVDFGLPATHNLASNAGHTLWNSIAKNALLKQLRDWRKIIVKDSGVNPTHLLLGTDAADDFIRVLDPDTATVGNSASSIRIDRGVVDPAFVKGTPGVIYWGYIKEVDLFIYSYDEYYWDGSANQPLVPAKKVWMGSPNARFDRHYAAIQDMDSLIAVSRFVKSWVVPDPSVRWLMMQSAPLMAPHQVDSFLVAAVLS